MDVELAFRIDHEGVGAMVTSGLRIGDSAYLPLLGRSQFAVLLVVAAMAVNHRLAAKAMHWSNSRP